MIVQVAVQRQVQVGQRLRLDALGGVDQQHRALARLQRARHLVGEVDVAGRVDQVQDVVRSPLDLPRQPDVLRLDGDAAFPLDVHPVQVLGAHVAVRDDAGELQHPVGQRRLAVVDVGDDAEVPNLRRRGEGLVGETADGNLLVQASYSVGAMPIQGIERRASATQSRASRFAYAGDYGVAVEDFPAVQRENLVFNEAPKLIRQLQRPETLPRSIQQGIKIGHATPSTRSPLTESTRRPSRPAGPVTDNSVPTAQRARRMVYAPDLDGRADPGEIVWTWVVYEDDPSRGKDRPVLVVGRDRAPCSA